MNWNEIQGNWKQMTGSMKQRWGKLTDNDLTFINGKRDVLIGKLQEQYGIAQDEADRQVDEWMRESNVHATSRK